VNPAGLPVYSGPTGTIRGTVTLTGDAVPVQAEVVSKIPAECASAGDFYGRPIREGMGRRAADILVAATGYEGYVPAKQDVVEIAVKDCTFPARLFGMTFGQTMKVRSGDARAYAPELLGSGNPVTLYARPGAEAVKLYPVKPRRYVLIDGMRNFMTADVFVMKYSTFDVTELDGKYEITGVPAGKVQLDALSSTTLLRGNETVEVKAGQVTTVDFTLEFDAGAFKARLAKEQASSASSGAPSAAPARSAAAPAASH
jgi:hypothetical protein